MMSRKGAIRDSAFWDYRLSWASTAFFIGSVGNASLKTILPIPDSLWGPLSFIVGCCIIFIYARCFKEMLRRSSKTFWVSVFVFIGIYTLSALLIVFRGEPLNAMITGTALVTFAWWIPTGVFARSVYDKSILYSVWVRASFVLSALAILMFFFYIPPELDDGSPVYNMVFGFYIILPLLIQINELIKNRRLWLLILVLFEVFTVIVYANRGVLLSLMFFCVYKFAFESNNLLRKVVSVLLLIGFTILMLSSLEAIAKGAVNLLDSFGFQSRTLDMLAEGVISDTSGRDDIWKICFNMIGERPILGWGLGGEYFEIARRFTGVGEAATAYTPHNGIIQNFVCFGVLGGFIASVLVINPLLHLKKHKDQYVHNLILIFASAAIIPECISASGFFITPEVSVCLYLFYSVVRFKKNEKSNDSYSIDRGAST